MENARTRQASKRKWIKAKKKRGERSEAKRDWK